MARRRVLPTPEEALHGIPLAIENAGRHLDAARVLGDANLFGPAVSHLIYSIEESEKARSIGQVWLNSWERFRNEHPTDNELRARIFDHPARHKAAASKSWAVGPVWTMIAEETRVRVRLSPQRTPAERVAMAHAVHPEALPADWEQRAVLMREGSLYVDLRDDGWHTPNEFTIDDYNTLRPKAMHYLRIVTTAFERHKSQFEELAQLRVK